MSEAMVIVFFVWILPSFIVGVLFGFIACVINDALAKLVAKKLFRRKNEQRKPFGSPRGGEWL